MRYQAEHSDAPGPRPGGVTFSAVPNGEPATCPGGPMEPTAPRRLVILTEGEFGPHHAKTVWGVIRYGRDEIVAILDSAIAGRNASEWLPGHGIAPTGGRLPDAWRAILLEAIRAGLDLHSGLHS